MDLVFDIEANGLLDTATTVHCISMMALGAHILPLQSFSSKPLPKTIGSIENALERLYEASTIIGHNIICYDLPLLEKLYGWNPNKSTKIVDTYVMSRLLNPDRLQSPGYTGKGGPHSLEAWGYRIGQSKPEHEDWTTLSSSMLRRNREDVEINSKLYSLLGSEMAGHNWTESLEIEHEVARVVHKQETNGVRFDIKKAKSLVDKLDKLSKKIDDTLLPNLPKKIKQKGSPITNPFKKDGTYSVRTESWMNTSACLVSGPFSKVEFLEMNLGSLPQVKEYLLSQGWVPTEWNYKDNERTSPKLTEDSFGTINGPIGTLIKQRILIKHRQSQIQGWIEQVRGDNRIVAGANTCGTNTGRFRHYGVVNVPKASTYPELNKREEPHPKAGKLCFMNDQEYQSVFCGSDMRSLFTCSPGRLFVGHDASGLELRILAHYMDDKEYIDALLNGDIHSLNQKSAGLDTREQAKTFIYAFLYGAGDEKIGSIVGGDAKDGAALKRAFLTSIPSLKNLIKRVKVASRKGWLRGLDNRKIFMRRKDGKVMEHKALNTLLQCGGAVVMKKSMILLDGWVSEEGLDALKVVDMHDEAQADVAVRHVERYSELAKKSVISAGEYFNLELPMDAAVKVGRNWAETH